ncbi:MAG: ComEA family DNA-binding protein [Phycisphaerae bacterium]|nr:helix-hairpin-helix domain-containing protein [Tepidisphaeraceae bacterium]
MNADLPDPVLHSPETHPLVPRPPKPSRWIVWTLRQRVALASLLLPVTAWLFYLALTRTTPLADPQPPAGPRAAELTSRVDPNTADWPTLAALPEIGEKTAQAIVEYRDAQQLAEPGVPVFTTPEDLMNVKGIGKATTRALQPHLVFPPSK